MFFTVVVIAIFAIIDPTVRRLGAVVAAISMVAFLVVYARAGLPAGALRSIAIVDLIGLIPLCVVGFVAWRTADAGI
ncbi:MAG: hypothetical protein AAF513_07720 [Pseudomonadota bacterium]